MQLTVKAQAYGNFTRAYNPAGATLGNPRECAT